MQKEIFIAIVNILVKITETKSRKNPIFLWSRKAMQPKINKDNFVKNLMWNY